MIEFRSNGLQDTERLGRLLAEVLPEQLTICLRGTLGAGKTKLVECVATAGGVNADEITSPTFVLAQHYHGKRTIHHFDAYRIADEDEFWELGVDEFFASQALTFVEWGERVAGCLPHEHLDIQIEIDGDDGRLVRLSWVGERPPQWMAKLEDELR